MLRDENYYSWTKRFFSKGSLQYLNPLQNLYSISDRNLNCDQSYTEPIFSKTITDREKRL